MSRVGIQQQAEGLLSRGNSEGAFTLSLVCTGQGLVVAAAGEGAVDDVAAITSLFEDVVARAKRDLGLPTIDEVTLLDPKQGRTVIRPIPMGDSQMFLVVRMHPKAAWRRVTNQLCRDLAAVLAPLFAPLEVQS